MDLVKFDQMVRPCMAKGNRAAFHRWVEHNYIQGPGLTIGSPLGGQVSYLMALVEFESGQVEEVRPNDVVFRDFAVNRLFGEYIYGDEEHYEEFCKMLHDVAKKDDNLLSQ